MMKKNRTIYFLLALVCLGLQSCLFQEEDYLTIRLPTVPRPM